MEKKFNWFELAAIALFTVAGVAVLEYSMLPGLLAGCVGFLLTQRLEKGFHTRKHAAELAAAVVIILPVLIVALIGMETSQALTSKFASYSEFTKHLATIALDWRKELPPSIAAYIPEGELAVQGWVTDAIKTHTSTLKGLGESGAHGMLWAFVGIVVGSLAAVARPGSSPKPLAVAVTSAGSTLMASFRQIVLAQFWIASINTLLTCLFIFVALPLCGVHIPYAGWLVLLTFVAGMFPIVGNLICNTVLTIAGLGVSVSVAVACLVFLIVVHKLEYAINAKVIGSKTHTAAWELILVMFVFETIFGVAGLVAAPLYYAYLKQELTKLGWI